MLSVILGIATVVCAVGWLGNRLSTLMLLWYLDKKGVPYPSKREVDEGTRWVVSHAIKDLFYSGKER